MKKVFVLGDSISIHYGPYLEAYLQGTFAYDRKGKNQECKDLNIASQVNGGDSGNVLEYLQLLPDLEYDEHSWYELHAKLHLTKGENVIKIVFANEPFTEYDYTRPNFTLPDEDIKFAKLKLEHKGLNE